MTNTTDRDEPVAWARRWYIDGETPRKERNANGRMAWPKKFTYHEVTKTKCFADDEPLYTRASPAPDDGMRERVAKLEAALTLALDYLGEMEPGDSRAVSDECGAMSAVLCGIEPNNPGEEMAIIGAALKARDNPNADAILTLTNRTEGASLRDAHREAGGAVVADDLCEAVRLLSRIVRVYGDIQDGNGNTPTEIRKAARFVERLSAPASDNTAGYEGAEGDEVKPKLTNPAPAREGETP